MDKHGEFTVKNELTYGRGYVYSLQYHLVWCTKYRKKVLRDGIDTECREMLEERHGSHAGPHPPAGGLQAAVLYPGHDKDHEGEPGAKAVHQAPGTQE